MKYYNQIRDILINNEVYKKVKDYSKNKNDLESYYNVRKLLIEAQGGDSRAKYGDGLIKEYSKRLTNDLGKKYSVTSLKYMRQFYLLIEKGQPVADKLTWSHYQELLPLNNIDKNLKTIYQDNTIGIIICKKDNKFIMEYCSDERILSREYITI